MNNKEIVTVQVVWVKLTGLITWSWLVVLIPLWISLGILVIFLICAFVVALHYRWKK